MDPPIRLKNKNVSNKKNKNSTPPVEEETSTLDPYRETNIQITNQPLKLEELQRPYHIVSDKINQHSRAWPPLGIKPQGKNRAAGMDTGGQSIAGGYKACKSFADKLKQNAHPRGVLPLTPPRAGSRQKSDDSMYKKELHSSEENDFTNQERNIDTEWEIVKGKQGSTIDAASRSEVKDLIKGEDNKDGDQMLSSKKDLTEEELEIMREKRRERRKREKETKKKLREQKKRAELYAPKSSKINIVSADSMVQSVIGSSVQPTTSQQCSNQRVLKAKVACSSTSEHMAKNSTGPNDEGMKKGIRFLDDEYPTLSCSTPPRTQNKTSKNLDPSNNLSSNENSGKCSNLVNNLYDSEGRTISDAGSASEWETEDECSGKQEFEAKESSTFGNRQDTDFGFVVVNNRNNRWAKKSILRKEANSQFSQKGEANAGKLIQSPVEETWSTTVQYLKKSQVESCQDKGNLISINKTSTISKSSHPKSSKFPQGTKIKSQEPKLEDSGSTKKVKKKDPITLDIMQAIQAPKKPYNSDKLGVLGSKLSYSHHSTTPSVKAKKIHSIDSLVTNNGPPVRNTLDSSAPTIRRGKEREKPKKKRPTKMRKIILADRKERQMLQQYLPLGDNEGIDIKSNQNLENMDNNANKADVDLHEYILDDRIEGASNVTEVFWPLKNDSNGAELNIPEDNISQVKVDEREELNNHLDGKGSEEGNTHKATTCQMFSDEGSETMLEPSGKGYLLEENKTDVILQAKKLLHTRKFRMHCNHILSKELDKLASSLLQDVIRFQDKKFAEDPVKAKARRRYVIGLREATKFMKVSKVACLILAPDIENVESSGGLNDVIGNLTRMAEETGEYGEKKPVPVFFVMNRYKLGKTCLRKVPVACVAILNYQGSDEHFKAMVEMLPALKQGYQDKLDEAILKINCDMVIPNESSSKSQNTEATKQVDRIKSGVIEDDTSTPSNQVTSINECMLSILRNK